MGNNVIVSQIIRALAEKNKSSVREIATWIMNKGTRQTNIEALKSQVKYHLTELTAIGIVSQVPRGRWIQYELGSGVEILDGIMISSDGEKRKHEDNVGKILRLENENGVVLKILELD